jgi:hypothetical protein
MTKPTRKRVAWAAVAIVVSGLVLCDCSSVGVPGTVNYVCKPGPGQVIHDQGATYLTKSGKCGPAGHHRSK